MTQKKMWEYRGYKVGKIKINTKRKRKHKDKEHIIIRGSKNLPRFVGHQIKTFFFVGIRNKKTYKINPRAIVSNLTNISRASQKRKEKKNIY